MLEPGELAPDFTLFADDGTQVSLSAFRGKPVVVYFYPKADTSGCTIQACAFRDARDELNDRGGAVVLGISPDMPAALAKFRDHYDLNFKLLSDPDHSVAEQYGAWGKKSMYGREYDGIIRSQIVVGPDGRVVAASKVSPKDSVPRALKVL